MVHDLTEAFAILLVESILMKLAQERGACEYYDPN